MKLFGKKVIVARAMTPGQIAFADAMKVVAKSGLTTEEFLDGCKRLGESLLHKSAPPTEASKP